MKLSHFVAVLNAAVASASTGSARRQANFVHPGLLHTEDDFERIRGLVSREPWATGLEKLSARADPDYEPNPQETICRGSNTGCENYVTFYRDVHSAYANAVYWKITGETAHADAAARTLDAWTERAPGVEGNADRFLAAGIYGYQTANAAELLRDYEGWDGVQATADWLASEFYPLSSDFLVNHNDAVDDNYWANWDLCNLAAIHAIGVLSDDQSKVDEALDYLDSGVGNGRLEHTIWEIHEEEGSGKPLGQNQESGRDQGHSLMNMGLLAALAQQSYNQGNDLFEKMDNRILAGAEYVFKYNAGHDVPFTEFTNSHGTAEVISDNGRGIIRPIAELIYAHYNGVKGLDAYWTGEYRDIVVEEGGGAEGGGGDYGPNSGGYDALGFGTLLFRLEE